MQLLHSKNLVSSLNCFGVVPCGSSVASSTPPPVESDDHHSKPAVSSAFATGPELQITRRSTETFSENKNEVVSNEPKTSSLVSRHHVPSAFPSSPAISSLPSTSTSSLYQYIPNSESKLDHTRAATMYASDSPESVTSDQPLLQDVVIDNRADQVNPNFSPLRPPPPIVSRQETLIDINQVMIAGPPPRMVHSWPTKVYGLRNSMTPAIVNTLDNHVLQVRKLLTRAKNGGAVRALVCYHEPDMISHNLTIAANALPILKSEAKSLTQIFSIEPKYTIENSKIKVADECIDPLNKIFGPHVNPEIKSSRLAIQRFTERQARLGRIHGHQFALTSLSSEDAENEDSLKKPLLSGSEYFCPSEKGNVLAVFADHGRVPPDEKTQEHIQLTRLTLRYGVSLLKLIFWIYMLSALFLFLLQNSYRSFVNNRSLFDSPGAISAILADTGCYFSVSPSSDTSSSEYLNSSPTDYSRGSIYTSSFVQLIPNTVDVGQFDSKTVFRYGLTTSDSEYNVYYNLDSRIAIYNYYTGVQTTSTNELISILIYLAIGVGIILLILFFMYLYREIMRKILFLDFLFVYIIGSGTITYLFLTVCFAQVDWIIFAVFIANFAAAGTYSLYNEVSDSVHQFFLIALYTTMAMMFTSVMSPYVSLALMALFCIFDLLADQRGWIPGLAPFIIPAEVRFMSSTPRIFYAIGGRLKLRSIDILWHCLLILSLRAASMTVIITTLIALSMTCFTSFVAPYVDASNFKRPLPYILILTVLLLLISDVVLYPFISSFHLTTLGSLVSMNRIN